MDARSLPPARRVLAVVAHPDDESFGLGAALDAFARGGAAVGGVCFTRGEASSLGAGLAELGRVRAAELSRAAQALGIEEVELLDHPDGGLAGVAVADLAAAVVAIADRFRADLLITFDTTGVTGHPDHVQATRAALRAAASLDVPVLGWTIPDWLARSLNAEFSTAFAGRAAPEIDIEIEVDRARQLDAIACHASQSASNRALWRRLELAGRAEHLRWLRPPGARRASPDERHPPPTRRTRTDWP